MTTTEARGKPKRRPGATPVFLASLALFCLLLGLIAYRAGSGFSADAAVSSPAPQRKLVIRRVVTTVVPGAGAGTDPAAPAAAPVEAEPAPVEPAPEPAPVVTSSS